ncbi:MAG: hypothetical protein RDU76_11595 [Candidatus Edwardsbacteria bacterium]|nr:hypothetical protein [Candidatus Edwardsbacteria bacterium]
MGNSTEVTILFKADGTAAIKTINGVEEAMGKTSGTVQKTAASFDVNRREINKVTGAINGAVAASGSLTSSQAGLLRIFSETAETAVELKSGIGMAAGAMKGLIAGSVIMLGIQAIAFTVEYLSKKHREAAEEARKNREEHEKLIAAFKTDAENTLKLLQQITDRTAANESMALTALASQVGGIENLYSYWYNATTDQVNIEGVLQKMVANGRAFTEQQRQAVLGLAEAYKKANEERSKVPAPTVPLSAGNVSGEDYNLKADELKRMQDYYDARYTVAMAAGEREKYLRAKTQGDQLNQLYTDYDNNLLTEGAYLQTREATIQRFADNEKRIKMATAMSNTQMLTGQAAATFAALAQQNKKFLGVAKAAAIVDIGVQATKAAWTVFGQNFWLGLAMAPLIAAKAAADIARVTSTSDGGIVSSGNNISVPTGGGASYPAAQERPADRSSTNNIYYFGSLWGALEDAQKDALARGLLPALNKAAYDGVQ